MALNDWLEIEDIEVIRDAIFDSNIMNYEKLLEKLHYSFTDYSYVYIDRYQRVLQRKMDYFNSIMFNQPTIKIDLTKTSKEGYSYIMYEMVLELLRNKSKFIWGVSNIDELEAHIKERKERHDFDTYRFQTVDDFRIDGRLFFNGEKLSVYLKEIITREEIETNKLKEEHKVGKKRFGAGGKVTRFLSAISDMHELHSLKDRYIGNMVPESAPPKILMTAHPIAGYIAGMISNSCLSPDSGNRHAGPISNGYVNTVMFITEDLKWRAFASFDFDNKYMTINSGYPNENFLLQYLLKNYFKDLGFSMVSGHFMFPQYWDTRVLFPEFNSKERNDDAFGSYNLDETITGTESSNVIIPAFYDSYNDDYDFDPDREYEDDYNVWCEYEEEYYYEDDVYFSEFLDSYISNYGEEMFLRRNFNKFIDLFNECYIEFAPEDAGEMIWGENDKNELVYSILRIDHINFIYDLFNTNKAEASEWVKKLEEQFNELIYDVIID